MTLEQIILACLSLTLGMVLQGAVGFGVALFAMPVLLHGGIPVEVAVALFPVVSLAQTGWNAWHYREHIPWRQTWWITVWRYSGLPVGILLLALLAGASKETAKQVAGVFILGMLVVPWLLKARPRENLHSAWSVLAGSLSGIMVGALGMGGPPLILWATAHDWPARRIRSFLYAVFFLFVPPWIALMVWRFGTPVLHAMLISIGFVPFVIAGAHLGSRLGDRLDRRRLRQVALGLLALVAISAIVEPWL